MLPKTRRRAAYTLIELLVVMAIIATLTSLIMAGVQRARVAGQRTENGVRMNQIGDAIGRCKHDLNLSYIPSHPLSGTVGGTTFTLKANYVQGDPELPILLQAFPNMAWGVNGGPGNPNPSYPVTNPEAFKNGYTGSTVTLDANQTLCLFLTGGAATAGAGFSNNPQRPFTAPSGGGSSGRGRGSRTTRRCSRTRPTATRGSSTRTVTPTPTSPPSAGS